MTKNFIKIDNIEVILGNIKILKNISFSFSSDEPVCIIGKGSSGKTTLLKAIAGLIYIQKGNILINNQTKQMIEEKKNFYDNLGIMFQKDALFDSLSVWENIMFRELNSEKKSKLIKKSYKFLKIVDLPNDTAFLSPSQLSGGMKKRVALARAISNYPKFLLLDEPTAGLDPIKTNRIFNFIIKLSKEFKIAVLTVTSDIQSAIHHFKKIILIKDSKIHWDGRPDQMINSKDKYVRKFI